MKDLGKANYCLGIEIQQDQGEITLSQRRYILNLLNRYGMDSCNPITTPMDKDTVFDKSTDGSRREEALPRTRWRTHVSRSCERSDIAHAVSVLSQFNDCKHFMHFIGRGQLKEYSDI